MRPKNVFMPSSGKKEAHFVKITMNFCDISVKISWLYLLAFILFQAYYEQE